MNNKKVPLEELYKDLMQNFNRLQKNYWDLERKTRIQTAKEIFEDIEKIIGKHKWLDTLKQKHLKVR